MAEPEPASDHIVSETQWWPNIALDFVEPTKDDHRLKISQVTQTRFEFHADGSGVIFWGDQKHHRFDANNIANIELQSRNEYGGVAGGGFKIRLFNDRKGEGPGYFMRTMGLKYSDLDPVPRTFQWIGILCLCGLLAALAFGAFEIALIQITTFLGGGPTEDYGYNAFTFTWWYRNTNLKHDQISILWTVAVFLGFAVSGAVIFFTARFFQDMLGEPDAEIYFDPSLELYVVHYLANGKRMIVASTYRDRSKAIEMHTDHLNAWNRWKAFAKDRGSKAVDEDYL